ncbi:hypothetical protein GCK32_011673, partial [Trichostrongylus colubriformis]
STTELEEIRTPGYNSALKSSSTNHMIYLLYIIPFTIAVMYIIFAFIYRSRYREKNREKFIPKAPKSEDIDPNKFEYVGPIKLQKQLRGKVEHALADDISAPLQRLAYDENLNEVADIGSVIDEIEGMEGTTETIGSSDKNATTLRKPSVMKDQASANLKPSKKVIKSSIYAVEAKKMTQQDMSGLSSGRLSQNKPSRK